jgi:hypothetical protein
VILDQDLVEDQLHWGTFPYTTPPAVINNNEIVTLKVYRAFVLINEVSYTAVNTVFVPYELCDHAGSSSPFEDYISTSITELDSDSKYTIKMRISQSIPADGCITIVYPS